MSWPRSTCTSRATTILPSLGLTLAIWFAAASVFAQETSPIEEPPPKSRSEIFGSVYVLGSFPKNRNFNVGGEALPSTVVRDGAGAGARTGIFPAFTNRILGIQGEIFGLGSEISAPQTVGSAGAQSGHATMLAWNTLVSLVLRYPGEQFQPYVGIGGGWSSALLVGTDVTRGGMTQSGVAHDTGFARQYIAGLRSNLTERLFVFGEYKYFMARYSWSGSLQPSLDFRAHIVAVGVGLSF